MVTDRYDGAIVYDAPLPWDRDRVIRDAVIDLRRAAGWPITGRLFFAKRRWRRAAKMLFGDRRIS